VRQRDGQESKRKREIRLESRVTDAHTSFTGEGKGVGERREEEGWNASTLISPLYTAHRFIFVFPTKYAEVPSLFSKSLWEPTRKTGRHTVRRLDYPAQGTVRRAVRPRGAPSFPRLCMAHVTCGQRNRDKTREGVSPATSRGRQEIKIAHRFRQGLPTALRARAMPDADLRGAGRNLIWTRRFMWLAIDCSDGWAWEEKEASLQGPAGEFEPGRCASSAAVIVVGGRARAFLLYP
jgi:hypothetical protein